MTNRPYNITINDLEESFFIAGTYQEYDFEVFDSNGSPINLESSICEWYLSPLGQKNVITGSKSGSIMSSAGSPNLFRIYLNENDTVDLSGKYNHQPKIIDHNGTVFRPSQGIITIIPAIY